MKKIVITIGVGIGALIVLASVAYIVNTGSSLSSRVTDAHDDAYQENYTNSYPDGYQVGYEKQYTIGYESGYQDGLEDGNKRGYDDGYENGNTAGWERGYKEGKQTGIRIGYKEGMAPRINVHNPSYAEAVDFLRRDETDEKPYIEDEYICTDYSAAVVNNAEAEGIRAAFVLLYRENNIGHTLVAFNTTDRGIIYFEPQLDYEAEPVVGKLYSECIVYPPEPPEPPPYSPTSEFLREVAKRQAELKEMMRKLGEGLNGNFITDIVVVW